MQFQETIKQDSVQIETLSGDPMWTWDVSSHSGKKKTLSLIYGDMCEVPAEYDVVVCSAFKNDYIPTPTSLIGALKYRKGISVEDLSLNPELDFRPQGCWLSKETGTCFRRIACVELLDYYKNYSEEDLINIILKKSFSTLRFILEQAEFSRIPVATVALPILGTGDQGIETSYVIGTLISQCQLILQTNSNVQNIVIYERDKDKAYFAASALNAALSEKHNPPDVFLSYSSKQIHTAKRIRDLLESRQINCWMAPYSIPAGSCYLEVIPIAISQTEVVLLLLTPEAEQSRWVKKEIGTAIGANKTVLPYQPVSYPVGTAFRFLLEGEQIFSTPSEQADNALDLLLQRITNVLNEHHAQEFL